MDDQRADVGAPLFTIACLFHRQLEVLERTLPRSLAALTDFTAETYEVVLHCDGTPDEVAIEVLRRRAQWGVDEVRLRWRERHLASGDASNNGHRRLFGERSRYLIVIEDDVLVVRDEPSFDVLGACRALFESHPDVPVICKLSDHDAWAWTLHDVGPPIEPGVRSVNRVATHFIAYDTWRFRPVATRFGAFDLDVFVDREDWSYNWEDVVSHVGTTGGRRIAWPDRWSLRVFHCDRKMAQGSIYNTQDPRVKHAVLDELEGQHGAAAVPERG